MHAYSTCPLYVEASFYGPRSISRQACIVTQFRFACSFTVSYGRYQHDGQTDYGDALYCIIICHVGKMGTLSVSSTAASGCFVLLLTQLGLACCNPVSSLLCDPNAPLVPQMCGRQISAF